MRNGYHGRILRVDLSSRRLEDEEHDDAWYRRHFGGAALSAYLLLRELPTGVDPFDPDNRLIIAAGPLTGIAASGFGRNSVATKSPLTGGLVKSEVGGFFGAELKHAGYDAIIVEGRAETPVYLWIKDGVAQLKDAGHVWGEGVLQTEDAIKAETGERFARIASIGPAGERLVRFACIINDLKDAAGRGGAGAVMGSKNLKAIAVRGKMPPALADPEVVRTLGKEMATMAPVKARSFHEYGTGANMVGFNLAGNLPTRNFRDGYFDNVDAITPQMIKDTIRVGMEACYACAVRCKKVVKTDAPWTADPNYGGPEYETLAAFGSDCGIDDLKAVARAHHLCNHYGMDTISAGATIAFAMECFDSGCLTKRDLDGLDLSWGNAEAMLQLLEMMGNRQGIGNLLAEGSRRAADRIDRSASELAMHVKGLEIAMHEPRYKQGLGLGYCVANVGGDHCTFPHDTFFEKEGPTFDSQARPLGITEPMPASELSARKANLFAQLHKWRTLQDSLCQCQFVPWDYDEIVRLVRATTGWDVHLDELLLVGERAITTGRVFNLREGLSSADDKLPRRFFTPPSRGSLAKAAQAVDFERMDEARSSYYSLMGWDPETGVPTQETLERLGLSSQSIMRPEKAASVPTES